MTRKMVSAAEVAEVLKSVIGTASLATSGKLEPASFDTEGGVLPESGRSKVRIPKIIDYTKSMDHVVVALMISKDDGGVLALDGGIPSDVLHITLADLGKKDNFDFDNIEKLAEAIGSVIDSVDEISGVVSGVGRFSGKESDDFYASFDSKGLHEFRDNLIEKLDETGVSYLNEHGFVPHITLAKLDPESDSPVDVVKNVNLSFDKIVVRVGASVVDTYDLVTKKRKRNKPDVATYKNIPVEKAYDLWVISEAGVHKHNLVRDKKKTGIDGSHYHMFLDEYGYMMRTEDDGSHEHSLSEEVSDSTENDGEHTHVVFYHDGSVLETSPGGRHGHEALVKNTAADGSHTHTLKLPDGETVTMLTAGEFWAYYKKQREERAAREAEVVGAKKTVESEKSESSEKWEVGIDIPIIKKDDDLREVTGIVLEPDEVDAQNDTISSEVIKKAAHNFLSKFNRGTRMGLMHKIFGEIGVELVESHITDVNKKINGKKVKKGSWIITIKVLDDVVWKKIKDGEITGFSIGGVATVV